MNKRGYIMANNTAISNEQIITALLNSGTIKEAAIKAGISERAIYDRMKSGEFQALYKSAKADMIRDAVTSINKHLSDAIKTIAEIMKNEDNNAAIRLQAAQTLLGNADKFTQRLIAAEAETEKQQHNNEIASQIGALKNIDW